MSQFVFVYLYGFVFDTCSFEYTFSLNKQNDSKMSEDIVAGKFIIDFLNLV